MSPLREESDRLYRHIRLDSYVLVTKTGQDGHRSGKGCLQNRYSDRYRDRQSDIELLNTCVPLSSCYTTPLPSLMCPHIKCQSQRNNSLDN